MGLHKTPKHHSDPSCFALTVATFTRSSHKMRRILALLIVVCCLSHSNATLRHLKAKLQASPALRRAVEYLAAPEPIPIAFARPTYTTHVSTFSVALPPVPATFDLPPQHVHQTTFAAPAVVHTQPLVLPAPSVVHPEPLVVPVPHAVQPQPLALPAPQVLYNRPEAVIVEPVVGHLVEGHFGGHYGSPLPLKGQIGGW